jgi:O-antigen/teichoic acid export membrane protein
LVGSLVAGLFIRFAFAFRERNMKFGTPGWEEMHSLIEYAKFTIIPSVGTQVYQWMDILIIGLFLSHASVGAYEVAWRTAAPVLLLSQTISVVIFPQISSWESSGSTDAIERLFSRVLTPSLIFVFPSIFGTVVLSKEILTLVFGSEYQVAWLALIVIMSGKISGSLRKLTGRLLYGLNKPKFVTIASIVELTANVVLNVILILQLGIVGAAIGTVVSVTIGTAIRTYYLSRMIDIRVPYDELGWCVVASIAMAVLLYGGKVMVGVNTIVQLGASVVTGAILYGFFVLLYSPLRRQIKTQIEDHVSFAS